VTTTVVADQVKVPSDSGFSVGTVYTDTASSSTLVMSGTP